MNFIAKIAMSVGAVFFCSGISAQSLDRQVVSSSGASQSASGVELNSTTGEAVTANFSSGTIILNQGFQQGDAVSTSIEEKEIKVDYTLYPNPTQNQVTLNLTAEKDVRGVVKLTSIDGKQIFSKRIRIKAGRAFNKRYSLEGLPEGMYVLTIVGSQGNAQVVERIQKVN